MNTFSVPADIADALPACSTMAAQQCETSSPLLLPDVGAVRHDRIAEDALDAHIRDLGKLSDQAMKDGDPTGSRIWSRRMHEAIASRSPAHQARLIAENERRINEGADYMQWQGRLAAELLAKREQG